MVSHRSLSDNSKSSQVFRTLLRILADLNITVVWMLCTRLLNFKSSSPYINPLVTVPSSSITIGITVTFMFHVFIRFFNKVQVFILLFVFFQCYSVAGQQSLQFVRLSFFCCLFIIARSGRKADIRWSVCIIKFCYHFINIVRFAINKPSPQ